MKQMIKYFLIVLSLFISVQGFSRLQVVTTHTVLQSIAKDIGGEHITAISLTRRKEDPHFVQSRPSFILKLRRADLYVEIGADLELWAKPLLQNSRNWNILPGQNGYVDASLDVNLLEKISGRVDRSHGDIHPAGNPHYWLDPQNAKIIARNIYNGLVRVDYSHREYYQSRLKHFTKGCDDLTNEIKKMFSAVKNRQVVTYHSSWIYFTHRFQLNETGHVESKPGVSPSAAHLSRLAAKMKEINVRIIIQTEFYSPASAKKLAGMTNAKLIILPNAVGGDISNYFELLRHIGRQISSHIKG